MLELTNVKIRLNNIQMFLNNFKNFYIKALVEMKFDIPERQQKREPNESVLREYVEISWKEQHL